MYRFYDKKSEEIVLKYSLNQFMILFENSDIKKLKDGLHKLALHTIKILDEMNSVDDYGTILLSESIRFLILAYKFQKHYDFNFEEFYKLILNKFHQLGYLLFKKEIKAYKMYKNKKFAFKINYNMDNEDITLVYQSLKNMRIDYGRYRTDIITQTYPKQSSLNYQFIEKLS